mmetsp:Transcript_44012/g.76697  ORF Transcript_44012/g.76697 Transcript_44012/m.76697 type:complete len:201 (+) Transcript_44012:194-796(+)
MWQLATLLSTPHRLRVCTRTRRSFWTAARRPRRRTLNACSTYDWWTRTAAAVAWTTLTPRTALITQLTAITTTMRASSRAPSRLPSLSPMPRIIRMPRPVPATNTSTVTVITVTTRRVATPPRTTSSVCWVTYPLWPAIEARMPLRRWLCLWPCTAMNRTPMPRMPNSCRTTQVRTASRRVPARLQTTFPRSFCVRSTGT